MSTKSNIYVAFLRGINVGGNTLVSMAELKKCFAALGFENVKTYINSGNVIFAAKATDPRKLEIRIEKALTESFSYSIAVVVLSYFEMEQVIAHIPKSWETNTEQRFNVIFLRYTIDKPEILDELKPKPGIEELYYHPGVLFWSAHTSDLTQSNMVKLAKSKLYKEMTVRNLNTTKKIWELMNSI